MDNASFWGCAGDKLQNFHPHSGVFFLLLAKILSANRAAERSYAPPHAGGGGLSAQGYPQLWKFSGSAVLKAKRSSVLELILAFNGPKSL